MQNWITAIHLPLLYLHHSVQTCPLLQSFLLGIGNITCSDYVPITVCSSMYVLSSAHQFEELYSKPVKINPKVSSFTLFHAIAPMTPWLFSVLLLSVDSSWFKDEEVKRLLFYHLQLTCDKAEGLHLRAENKGLVYKLRVQVSLQSVLEGVILLFHSSHSHSLYLVTYPAVTLQGCVQRWGN